MRREVENGPDLSHVFIFKLKMKCEHKPERKRKKLKLKTENKKLEVISNAPRHPLSTSLLLA